MRANREAFERWRIVPRVLRDVSACETGVELFGERLPAPFLPAPVGVLALAHRDGDLGVARAAAADGTPMIFSNQASYPMERCAAAMGGSPRWFQLYWSTSNELVESFAARAGSCGCRAIIVTLDTTMRGRCTRDLELGYLPFLRALVLGASSVLIGRPYVYGLALAGETGVQELSRNLRAEFDLTLGLSGHASASQLDRDALVRAS
jgi:L-lactate dehydrogenase (cytochrome)